MSATGGLGIDVDRIARQIKELVERNQVVRVAAQKAILAGMERILKPEDAYKFGSADELLSGGHNSNVMP